MTIPGARLLADALGPTWPVLAFLLLVTIAAELLDRIGVFVVTAHRLATAARGRTPGLFAMTVALAVVCTSVAGLDATAVLLTPVAIGLARSVRVSPVPFALACVWLANTASLVSPVGNLTTLLALGSGGGSVAEHVARTWAPQLVLVAVTVAVVIARHHRDLRGHHLPPTPPDGVDGPAVTAALGCLAVFVTAVLADVPAWMAAAGLVCGLVLVMLLRPVPAAGPRELAGAAPWTMAAVVALLFVASTAVGPLVRGPLASALGSGSGVTDIVRVAAVGALGANALDNLPAYLLLSHAVDGPDRSIALLVGVNAGPLVTPWGSLATLLWLRVCHRHGLAVSYPELLGGGAVVAALSVVLATPLLAA